MPHSNKQQAISSNSAVRRGKRRAIPKRTPLEVIIGLVVLIAIWWIIAALIGSALILPSPPEVLARLFELAGTGEFWLITGSSLLRILIGFACGMIVGVLLAVGMHWNRVLRTIFFPVIHIVRATPVVSFIIIALIFIQTPFLPSFISFLMVLPVAWQNIETGLSNVDQKLLEMADLFQMGRWRKIRYIYVDSLKPYFLSAASSCMGLAWKSGVTAEVIAAPVLAIGRQLDEAKVYLQTTDLFAWTITLIVISLILETLIKWVIQKARTQR